MNTFLYLEDDEDDIFFFDKAINEINSNCIVLYAASGVDLMYLLKKEKPDIIFLDIVLTDECGIATLKKIRAIDEWNDVPIVMYSNQKHEHLAAECFREKANLYVEKPKKYEEIVDTLRKIVFREWPVAVDQLTILQ